MKFSELQLEASLSNSIEKLGYKECTPIQESAIPPILEGQDVSGLAQTGTGKTAAFLIPLMDRLLKARRPIDTLSEDEKLVFQKRAFADWKAQNYILILVPTRELAEQVGDNVAQLGAESGIRGIAIYGGTGYDKQKEAFRNGTEIIVATPGRLIDLFKDHVLDLKQVRAVVFDEADRMFDMGFKEDMKFILSRIPRDRQLLVFSATLNFDVLNTAYQFGANPVEVNISPDQAKADNVKDEIFHIGHHEKPAYLLSLLKKHNPKQAIIFSNFKMNVEMLTRFLTDNGVPAVGISSLLSQAQRNRVMEQFKGENEKNIMVATDVAARGLDIKGVDMVINFELPQDAESYVHRIGRTGRAGTLGQAFSLVCDRDVESLGRIQEYLKNKIEIGWLESSEIVTDFKPLQSDQKRNSKPFDRPSRDQQRGQGQPTGRGDRNRSHAPRNKSGPQSANHGLNSRSDAKNSSGGPNSPHSDKNPQKSQQMNSHRRPHPKGGNTHHKGKGPGNGQAVHPNGRGPQAAKRPSQTQFKNKTSLPPKSQKPAAVGVMKKVKGFLKKILGS